MRKFIEAKLRRASGGIHKQPTSGIMDVFVHNAMQQAHVEFLPNDHVFYGEIPGVRGVHATGETYEACHQELASALQDWTEFRVARGLTLPDVESLHTLSHVPA